MTGMFVILCYRTGGGGGREAVNNRISSAAGSGRLLTTGQAVLGGQVGC